MATNYVWVTTITENDYDSTLYNSFMAVHKYREHAIADIMRQCSIDSPDYDEGDGDDGYPVVEHPAVDEFGCGEDMDVVRVITFYAETLCGQKEPHFTYEIRKVPIN